MTQEGEQACGGNIKYFYFFALVIWRRATLNSAIQNAVPQEFDEI